MTAVSPGRSAAPVIWLPGATPGWEIGYDSDTAPTGVQPRRERLGFFFAPAYGYWDSLCVLYADGSASVYATGPYRDEGEGELRAAGLVEISTPFPFESANVADSKLT